MPNFFIQFKCFYIIFFYKKLNVFCSFSVWYTLIRLPKDSSRTFHTTQCKCTTTTPTCLFQHFAFSFLNAPTLATNCSDFHMNKIKRTYINTVDIDIIYIDFVRCRGHHCSTILLSSELIIQFKCFYIIFLQKKIKI